MFTLPRSVELLTEMYVGRQDTCSSYVLFIGEVCARKMQIIVKSTVSKRLILTIELLQSDSRHCRIYINYPQRDMKVNCDLLRKKSQELKILYYYCIIS